jgi:hypothetical protein
VTTALFTDRYELSMLEASLRSDRADAPAVFEVFTRRLAGAPTLEWLSTYHFSGCIPLHRRPRGLAGGRLRRRDQRRHRAGAVGLPPS